MKNSKISIRETGFFSSLFLDYIEGEQKLSTFYENNQSLDAFKIAIENKTNVSIDRIGLANVLIKQYQDAEITEIPANIHLLAENNTFTVCTGHQLCLLTGPMYFIYKILTTINLANALKEKYPNYFFVPIYWMATEDHDFLEINNLSVFGKKLEWDASTVFSNPQLLDIPVGSLSLATLNPLLDNLFQLMGEAPYAEELKAKIKKAYGRGRNLADATRIFVHELLGKFGLVIIDPDDLFFKNQFKPYFKADIERSINYVSVKNTNEQLKNLNYPLQVNPRECNVFLMEDGHRVKFDVDKHPNWKELLEENPTLFSPNVIMRPMFQEVILPNLAYVGGPGEIAYWLQYKQMFEANKIQFPILVSRNFCLLVDAKSSQIWEKLGFSPLDYFLDKEKLIGRFVRNQSDEFNGFEEEQLALNMLYSKLSQRANSIDSTLVTMVNAELEKAKNGVKNIEAKIIRAGKAKHETQLNQVKKIKEKLFPYGELQERTDSFIPHYIQKGDFFFHQLMSHFSPFEKNFLILEDR